MKKPHHEVEFYTPREVATLLDELSLTPPYDLLVRFACKTGLRPGELETLRIGDIKHINFTRGHVQARRPKSSAANREVPLSDGLTAELRAYFAQHPHHDNADAYSWPGRAKGGDPRHHLNGDGSDRRISHDKPLRVEGVYRSHVLPALRERGLREMEWYAFRHFYASSCAARGCDIHTVAKLMGHVNISLTYSTYIYLFPNHQDMSRLDALDAVAPRSSNCADRRWTFPPRVHPAAVSEVMCMVRTRFNTPLRDQRSTPI